MITERDELRKVFFGSWQKHKENTFVEPIEAMIIGIILAHPEYHDIFNHPENISLIESHETNPFLHISLHLALREQLSVDRPHGIKLIYETLCKKTQDTHLAEHQMLDRLVQILWDAQNTGNMVDEKIYLEKLQKLI